MSSVDLKGDDKYIQSPTNTVPSRTGYDGDGDEDMSPESISATSRKESPRASERVIVSVNSWFVETTRTIEYEYEHTR